ncbi:hypothetical protein CROQUDRAFT_68001 [Cronartium quercuum f. sp. fusiforme G11]|uniref:2-(3-amino-3-carboxypropyl)histidine synthase subunit 2 n=1 Tax=Cronartium quercuum f. sp. fusiforme G11 TaxID=708437 RepID=A0A9P6T8P9_9BASI|nr:hypothetical protein CROQUDRAFT_68001 [Cronartium quercuum f. sp. fusiforme G11]
MSLIGPSGEAAIHDNSLELPVEPMRQYSDEELISTYQIMETANWIQFNQYHIIGLQFPDFLLPISVRIFKLLRSRLPASEDAEKTFELYLMADTTYGSCCVDCLAAQHVAAEAIVHYGPACLTTIAHLAVYYVLPRLPLQDSSIPLIAKELYSSFEAWFEAESRSKDCDPPQLLLMYDVGYHWKVDQIFDFLKKISHFPITLNSISTQYSSSGHNTKRPESEQKQCSTQSSSNCCQTSAKELSSCGVAPVQLELLNGSSNEADVNVHHVDPQPPSTATASYSAIFYIGPNSRRLTHVILTHSSIPVFALDPSSSPFTCESQLMLTKKLLMKRYATIQRARDADVFGILVGTLGVQHDLRLIHRTKNLIERKFKKKSYVVSVGKLKPEKLINFFEIECWVLIACPEHSLLDEGVSVERSKQYNVPVITPWELDFALRSCIEQDDSNTSLTHKAWDGQYVLDFDRLLSIWDADSRAEEEAQATNGRVDPENEVDAPVFSMITGQYKYRKTWNHSATLVDESRAVLVRDGKQELIKLVNGAASDYATRARTYNGLQPRLGLDPPSQMEKGRFGIAQTYGDERVEEDIKT